MNESTDWLAPNNLGVAFAFFMKALPIRMSRGGLIRIPQLVIDSIWH